MNILNRNLILGVLVLLWTIFPFIWLLWSSLMTEKQFSNGIFSWILEPTMGNYLSILNLSETDELHGGQTKKILYGFINSLLVSIPTAFVATIISALGGYAFGRYIFPFKTTMLFGLLTTRLLPPIAILIPYFIFFKFIGLVGNLLSLFIVYLTSVVPLLTWMLMGYFSNLPIELEKAGRMDGCSRIQILTKVLIPLSMPGISTCFMIAFLFAWNELLFGLILTGGSNSQTLSPALLAISPLTSVGYSGVPLFASACILSIIPPLILALYFQKFISNLNFVDPVTTKIS